MTLLASTGIMYHKMTTQRAQQSTPLSRMHSFRPSRSYIMRHGFQLNLRRPVGLGSVGFELGAERPNPAGSFSSSLDLMTFH
jgi:hypothetical protein